jgi:hypothetical protein
LENCQTLNGDNDDNDDAIGDGMILDVTAVSMKFTAFLCSNAMYFGNVFRESVASIFRVKRQQVLSKVVTFMSGYMS